MVRSQPAQLNDPAIVERHACPVGEIALVKRDGKFLEIQLITPAAAGQFDRKPILIGEWSRSKMVARMMDIHAGICAAQHAARAGQQAA